jgi:putative phage-type endonuclease
MTSRSDRKIFIGGSDIAAVLGLSEWKTPLDLYLQKTGQWTEKPDADREKIFRRGHDWEPIVVRWLAEDYGMQITRRSIPESPNYYTDQECNFLACEIDSEFTVTEEFLAAVPELDIDRSLIGTTQNIEIKSVSPFAASKWGEQFTDEIPIDYGAQGMFGLMVTGRQLCVYGVVFGADNLTLYLIKRDQDTINAMKEKAITFWHEHVLKLAPPDPSNMSDIKYLLAKFNGRPVDLTVEMATKLKELEQVRNAIKANEAAEESLMFEVGAYVYKAWGIANNNQTDDNALLNFNGRTIATWKKQRGAFLDQKGIKADYPDIHSQYMREHFFRVLRFKK